LEASTVLLRQFDAVGYSMSLNVHVRGLSAGHVAGAKLHAVLDSGTNVKNKTDMTLALDALEAAFEHPSSTFMIVSEDKDFEPLVMKLKARGCVVIVATAGASRSYYLRFYSFLFVSLSEIRNRRQ
jgi:uncharacterized LabA/DUF88 family protein